MNNTLSTAQTANQPTVLTIPACTRRTPSLPAPVIRTFVRACVCKFDMVLVLSLMAASAAYAASAFTQLG